MEDYLLDEESIITRSPEDEVVLTSVRLRHSLDNGRRVVSIMLDNIDSVRTRYESKPLFLVFAFAALLATPFLASEVSAYSGVVSALAVVICVILFFATRRNVISVYSNSSTIEFQTKGMDKGKVLAFINNVEDARKNFMKF